MVAVCVFIFIDDHTRLGVRGDIIVATGHCTLSVHISKEHINGIRHRVCATERSDHSGLFQRVSLFLDLTLHHSLLSFRNRPFS